MWKNFNFFSDHDHIILQLIFFRQQLYTRKNIYFLYKLYNQHLISIFFLDFKIFFFELFFYLKICLTLLRKRSIKLKSKRCKHQEPSKASFTFFSKDIVSVVIIYQDKPIIVAANCSWENLPKKTNATVAEVPVRTFLIKKNIKKQSR